MDIGTAAAAGADLVEIRFDRWSETARASAGQLFPAPVPLVATFRSTDEGGEGPTDPLPRRQWVERVARLPFAYVDLELARDVVDGSPVEGDRAIGSCHFPDGTPVDAVAAFLARAPASCRFVKAVVPLTVGQFVRDLLPGTPAGPATVGSSPRQARRDPSPDCGHGSSASRSCSPPCPSKGAGHRSNRARSPWTNFAGCGRATDPGSSRWSGIPSGTRCRLGSTPGGSPPKAAGRRSSRSTFPTRASSPRW